MIFANNNAKKIQSPEVSGKIQSVPGLETTPAQPVNWKHVA
jgi:hypothetical protein